MPSSTWRPTTTPAELLARLSVDERLLGYDLLLDTAALDLEDVASDCLRSSRPTRSGRVPSVLAVLDDRVVEYWLVGNTVRRDEVRRPGTAVDPDR